MKAPGADNNYYLITAQDGNVYAHLVDVAKSQLLSKNKLLGTYYGNEISFTAYDDEINSTNSYLYTASINQTTPKVEVKAYSLTASGFGGGVTMKTIDLIAYMSAGTGKTNWTCSVGEIQISPDAQKLAFSYEYGYSGAANHHHRIEYGTLNKATYVSLGSYVEGITNYKERTLVPVGKYEQEYKLWGDEKILSFDFSPSSDKIWYAIAKNGTGTLYDRYLFENSSNGKVDIKVRTFTLNGTSAFIEQGPVLLANKVNASIRRAVDGKMYLGAESLYKVGFVFKSSNNRLLSYTTPATGTATMNEIIWDGSPLITGNLPINTVRNYHKRFKPIYHATAYRELGKRTYEIKDHLGNVRVTLSDARNKNWGLNETTTLVKSWKDYYAFGWAMPGRKFSGVNYRYGFNGMEKDDEISGEGNNYTAEFWNYDSRLGRRWNIDPVYKSGMSNYLAFGDNPILYVDPNGDDWGSSTNDDGGTDYQWFDGEVEDGWTFVSYRHDYKLPEGANALNSPSDFSNVKTPVSILIANDNSYDYPAIFKDNVQTDQFGDKVENNWRVIDVTKEEGGAAGVMDAFRDYYGDRIQNAILFGHGAGDNTESSQRAKIAWGSLYKYPSSTQTGNNASFFTALGGMIPEGREIVFNVCYSNKIVEDIAKTYLSSHKVYGASNMELNIVRPNETYLMSTGMLNGIRIPLKLNLYYNRQQVNKGFNYFQSSYDSKGIYFDTWSKN